MPLPNDRNERSGGRMRLIAFTGLPRSGKDTAADYLVSEYGFTRVAFADPLKEAAAILLGRPLAAMRGEGGFDREAVLPEWGFSTRWFLQVLGTECMRCQVREDFWLMRARRTIEEHVSEGRDRIVITDCRFENEVGLVRTMGGLVARIERPGLAASSHVSDKPMPYDVMIRNDSTLGSLYVQLDLYAEVKSRPTPEQS